MTNLSSTLQPVLFLATLRTKIIKQPSASVRPVINQGFNKEVILNLSGRVVSFAYSKCPGTKRGYGVICVVPLEMASFWSPPAFISLARREYQYSLLSLLTPFCKISISSTIPIRLKSCIIF